MPFLRLPDSIAVPIPEPNEPKSNALPTPAAPKPEPNKPNNNGKNASG